MKKSIGFILMFLLSFNLETVSPSFEHDVEQSNLYDVSFSERAKTWADSVYNTLTLEEKVARLFIIKIDADSVADLFKKKSVFPSFVIGDKILVSKTLSNKNNKLFLNYLHDISNGFDCGVAELPFPNDKTMISLETQHLTHLYPILINFLKKNGVSLFLASENYPLYEKNILQKKSNTEQSVWLLTGKLENGIPEAIKLNVINKLSDYQSFCAGNIFISDDFFSDTQKIISAIKNNELSESVIEKICKYILAFTYESNQNNTLPIFDVDNKQKEIALRKVYENSISIIQKNRDNPFPISKLDINIGYFSEDKNRLQAFRKMSDKYVKKDTNELKPDEFDIVFWLLGKNDLRYKTFEKTLSSLKERYSQAQVILVIADDLPFVVMPDNLDALIYSPSNIQYSWKVMAEAAFGGIEVNYGKKNNLLLSSSESMTCNFPKIRLKYGIPEEAEICSDTLEQIDNIIADAIKNEATPGARILIARNGIVVFDKCYGWHTYDKERAVEKDDVYDLASITKIVAATPVLMRQYDLKKWKLTEELANFIPEADITELRGITMKQLLLHESGLPSYIPFYTDAIDYKELKGVLFSPKESPSHPVKLNDKLFMNKTAKYRDDIFNSEQDIVYSVPVAQNFFMNYNYLDTMFHRVLKSKVRADRKYLYSDVSFILLQKVAEKIEGESLDKSVNSLFYNPIGANTLQFNPLLSIPLEQIVPTENDISFRHQLLQGYVHDQAAAMMGGVAGHAGLFGNANDLAKMLQMLLNKGVYGGHRYLSSETVDIFTKTQSATTKRGLGFDKYDPEKKAYSQLSSPLAYGHSGFTGTMVWVDPEYNLIYVFLSNRIYPYQYNTKLSDLGTRSKVLEVIYKSLR